MTTIRESQLVDLTPEIADGIVDTFVTPTAYRSGSIRVFVNGVEYSDDDSAFGWTEIDQYTIKLATAPLAGDVMACFYLAKDAAEALGVEDVRGSPFAPGEVC